MSYQAINAGLPADNMCNYGRSKLRFRGPKRALSSPYLACLGGEETFGRFVDTPFPAALECRLDRRCINLGSLFSGGEALTQDADLLEIANRSEICVLQVPGLLGQSNRFYRVHPRRNDRVIAPTQDLVALYPEEDFTEIHFVRHLMARLREHSDDRFAEIVQELRRVWLDNFVTFLKRVDSPVVLLALNVDEGKQGSISDNPISIGLTLTEALRPYCAAIITLNVQVSGVSDELEDMLFGTLQQPIAEHVIGPATHRKIADRLACAINDLGL